MERGAHLKSGRGAKEPGRGEDARQGRRGSGRLWRKKLRGVFEKWREGGRVLRTRHFRVVDWTLYTSESTVDTWQTRLYYTLEPSRLTAHLTRCTPHFSLHTLHLTRYTGHSTLYTPDSTLATVHPSLHILPSTRYTLHCTLDTLYAWHATHCTLDTLHFTLYTLHIFTLHTRRSTLYTLDFTLDTLHSTLHTVHVALYILYSCPTAGHQHPSATCPPLASGPPGFGAAT